MSIGWRDVALVLLTVLIAPPLSAVTLLLAERALAAGLGGWMQIDVSFLLVAMIFSYPLAGFSALLIGSSNAALARLLPGEGARLLLALPVGAVIHLVTLGWLNEEAGSNAMTAGIALAAAGALGSIVPVALFEAFRRRRGGG